MGMKLFLKWGTADAIARDGMADVGNGTVEGDGATSHGDNGASPNGVKIVRDRTGRQVNVHLGILLYGAINGGAIHGSPGHRMELSLAS